MRNKKIIYIAGPITGVPKYWEAFEKMEDDLTALGFTVLTPSRLPADLPNERALPICMGMVQAADAVVMLPGAQDSRGAVIEGSFAGYLGKPVVPVRVGNIVERFPRDVQFAYLRHDLREALGEEVTP